MQQVLKQEKAVDFKTKAKPLPIRKVKNWRQIAKIALLITFSVLNVLTFLRITLIGQALDDIFHRLIFGWLKYLYFMLVIVWYVSLITRKKLFKMYWNKIPKIKFFWTFINVVWLLGLISFLVVNIENNARLSYRSYRLDTITVEYFEKWRESYVLDNKISSAGDFFGWNGVFSSAYDGGGLGGVLVAGVSTYLHIIGAFILNFISWSFLIIYFLFNHPFFMFLKKEQREQYYWNKFNKKQSSYFEPSVLSKIDKQEVTIQIPIEKKTDSKKPAAPAMEVWDLEDD